MLTERGSLIIMATLQPPDLCRVGRSGGVEGSVRAEDPSRGADRRSDWPDCARGRARAGNGRQHQHLGGEGRMAFKITEDCISCGACESVCPNQAISQGPEFYEIDPNKCKECEGSYDTQQCASVCPVDACVKA